MQNNTSDKENFNKNNITDKEIKQKAKQRNDIILIAILIAVTAVISGFLYLGNAGNDSKTLQLQILIDGKLTQTHDLCDELKTITLDTGNVVVIENGEAYMKEASCPDGLCMKQGHISKAGESIICLPHKVVLRIISNSSVDESGLDVMPR